jgi:glycosyltransferase involved in cell wall biosynthesis
MTSAGSRIPPERMRSLWIAWHAHRRTLGLCAAWNVPLHVVDSDRGGILRWAERGVETLKLLHRHRPRILFVPNPSLALTVLAFLARRIYRFHLIVDAHNEGVRPFARANASVRWLTRRLLKGADATIVSNGALAGDVRAAGGRPLVLPDRLPEPPASARDIDRGSDAPEIVVIATFAPDEPIAAVVEAAAKLPEIGFAVTGDAARFTALGIALPPNVRLTGFLPDVEYWELLAQAAVVCDLTLKSDCLVCGAYEALALAKPMVLSDNPPTHELFGPAAVLTGGEPHDIATALRTAFERREMLATRLRALRETYRARWRTQAEAVRNAIRDHAGEIIG